MLFKTITVTTEITTIAAPTHTRVVAVTGPYPQHVCTNSCGKGLHTLWHLILSLQPCSPKFNQIHPEISEVNQPHFLIVTFLVINFLKWEMVFIFLWVVVHEDSVSLNPNTHTPSLASCVPSKILNGVGRTLLPPCLTGTLVYAATCRVSKSRVYSVCPRSFCVYR